MTDRELLVLAAKAAGIQGRFIESFPEDGAPTYSCGIGNAGRITPPWNALASDGDALRLAVKLRLEVNISDYGTSARAAGGRWYGSEAHMHGGIEAATRRAIVRAAAAIGEAMP